MYLLYAGPNRNKGLFMESMLFSIDKSKTLLSVKNGYLLLDYLQKVKNGQSFPALIILEVDMPRLNGRETIELLKTDDIYRLIPVVVLYAGKGNAIADYCLKMGVDCLPQPNSSVTWTTTVQQLCNRCTVVD